MIIRVATLDDLDAIKELFQELDTDAINSQPEHFQRGERTTDYLSGIINDDISVFLLAEINNEIVGFSLLYIKEIKGLSLLVPCKYAYLQDFIVKENFRNKGIGSQLLNESKKWAKIHGMEYLRLSVLPNNKNAQRFYARHGLSEQMITMECPLHTV